MRHTFCRAVRIMTSQNDPLNLSSLLSLGDGWEIGKNIEAALKSQGSPILLEGLPATAKGWLLARLVRALKRPLVVPHLQRRAGSQTHR